MGTESCKLFMLLIVATFLLDNNFECDNWCLHYKFICAHANLKCMYLFEGKLLYVSILILAKHLSHTYLCITDNFMQTR